MSGCAEPTHLRVTTSGLPKVSRYLFYLSPNSRGSGSACESDGDDSDGQGAPQGGGGVQSIPVSARAAEILGVYGVERPVS